MDTSSLLLVAVGFAGLAVGFWFGKRSGGARSAGNFLLLYEGTRWEVHQAKRVEAGVQVDKTVYPEGVITPLRLGADCIVYIAGIERVALADHEALERARLSVVLAEMFSGAGDIARTLQLAGVVVPLLVALWMGWTVAGLGGQIASTQVGVQSVLTTMKEGLVCKV
jgi:hypothetical protein